ncbi:PAAR-like domain-containing protein [Sorangium sp. So ce321]|uniref:PAAR-like domain-containing protein n=1 Tax=Sorangium sp. So ce321 TaxID=3133300 RepID=UPI003F61AF9C
MGKVTALHMDTITEKSGHQMTGMAVSVCLTPAAPSPLPIPYPTMGTVAEGVIDPCMRTKIEGAKILTVGGCMKACHGNEPGTLKEVVSLNTGGPCFPWLGAPNVLIELGMAGITGSMGQMNKSITVGAGATASSAGGNAGGGGGGGGGAGGPGGGGPQGGGNGGGGGGGSNQGAGPPSPPAAPGADGQADAGHPVDIVTGTMFTPPETDFLLPGPLPVSWIRTYRTSSVQRECGIGRGWSHALCWQAELHGDRLTLIDETLRATTLTAPAGDVQALLPFGRRVYWEGDALVVDLDDGILRVLARGQAPGTFRLAQLRDRAGNLADITWDEREVVQIVDSVGRRAWLVREGQFRSWWVAATGADGVEHTKRLVTYELDARGDLARAIDAGGVETRYAYDDEHYLLLEQQPGGLRYNFVYADVAGERRCVETWGDLEGADILQEIGAPEASMAPAARPRGLFHMRFQYGPGPHETTVIDGLGYRFHYKGNALGLVERYQDPAGQQKHLSYNAVGQVVSSTTPDGTERSTYDAMGRLASLTDAMGRSFSLKRREDGAILEVRDPAGARYTFDVGADGQMLERTDPLGAKTRYEYDKRGRVVAIVAPDGSTETFEHDAHGNLAARTLPRGGTARYTYDLFGQLVRVELPGGAAVEINYDSRGLPVRVRAPGGVVVERTFNDARRPVSARHPGGGVSSARYVGHLVVEETQSDGSRYRLGYDARGRLAWVKNPAGEPLTIERDACGRVVRTRTFSGVETTYEHDVRGRIVRAEVAGTTVRKLAYDACGDVIRREDGDVVTTLEYDDRGFVRRGTRGATEVLLERDAAGRIVSEEQRVGGWRYRVDRAFDAKGWATAKRYSTGWQVQMGRGPSSGIESITLESAVGVERILREVDAYGRETARVRENGYAIRTERDSMGRPIVTALEDAAGQPVRARRYAWSKTGPLEQIVDSASGKRTYELDVFGRPLAVSGLGAQEQIRYDANGTPLRSAEDRVGPGGRVLGTAAAAFTWDAQGRLASRAAEGGASSWTYAYDGLDALVRAARSDGLVVQYHVDAFNRRLGEVRSDGASTWFGWDDQAQVEEVSSSGASVRRVFADDEITPLLEGSDAGVWRSVVTDATATPWLMVDPTGAATGQELGAFGAVTRREGPFTALRFAGQRHDELTGLSYHRARYYSPELGTFTTPDPLWIDASMFDLAFVPNVTLWVDPLGLVILLMSDDPTCVNGANARRAATGQNIVHYSQLGNPNALAGETDLYVYGHGSPGTIHYADPSGRFTGSTMSGQQLGSSIRGAGFTGNQVHMTVCHGGTDPPGQPGGSIAQSVANATGATTLGCVGDKMYDHPTIPGVTIAGPAGSMQPFTRRP